MAQSQLMMAVETFVTNRLDGSPVVVHARQTFLFDDDELVRRFPQNFQVSADHHRPDVEETTAVPGEKRGDAKSTGRGGTVGV